MIALPEHRRILVTGATGLVGRETLRRMLRSDDRMHAFALVRDRRRWRATAERLGPVAARVDPVVGDITRPGFGLAADLRARLARRVRAVVHAAADTTFSRPLAEARAVNVEGTRHALELAHEWPHVERFAFVSTAFVAGERCGLVREHDDRAPTGWVNAYERSKYEAECLVRAAARPWVILRPSTIVCDSTDGSVTQFNAVHRALRLYHAGLASLMPGEDENPVDVVTNAYVADAVARLALREDTAGRTYHLCAGAGAMPIGELLDRSHHVWSRDPAWRRRGVPRPALTDLATYRLFEDAVETTGDRRLREITRSLSHFVPQLALPKRFDTTRADAALGSPAPPVRSFWTAMLDDLLRTRWGAGLRRAA